MLAAMSRALSAGCGEVVENNPDATPDTDPVTTRSMSIKHRDRHAARESVCTQGRLV